MKRFLFLLFAIAFQVFLVMLMYRLTHDTGALVFVSIMFGLGDVFGFRFYGRLSPTRPNNETYDQIAKVANPVLKAVIAWILVGAILSVVTLILLVLHL
jgi:hypothetical protein